MNIILTFLLALIPAAFPFKQLPAQVGQSKENLSVSIDDLRNAPIEVVLDGRSLSLSDIRGEISCQALVYRLLTAVQ